MDLRISGHHTTLTDAIKKYAEKRLEKLDRRFNFPVSVNLKIRKEETKSHDDRFIAEVTIPLKHGYIRSEERAESPYTAIDLVQSTVERRIRRYKTRFEKRRRESVPISGLEEEIASQLAEAAPSDEEEPVLELEYGQLVRTKRHLLTPMSVQEAAAQMDLLGHNFFVFKNRDTDGVNVVYRRHDDDYGLIVPEDATK